MKAPDLFDPRTGRFGYVHADRIFWRDLDARSRFAVEAVRLAFGKQR